MFHYLKKLSQWWLPHTCILCGNLTHSLQDLCSACKLDLPILTQSCQRCANVLTTNINGLICGQCIHQPPPFDYTHSLFLYQPPVTHLIRQLKFSQKLLHARLLGELLAEKICSEWYQNKSLPTVIIPIPLHPKRLQTRGFNQALEIARPIAKQLKLPIITRGFSRIKPTLAQATLPSTERRKNIRQAFAINYKVENQAIAVIDDIVTTGNTIREFCSLLKKNGAARIDVWCCARPNPK